MCRTILIEGFISHCLIDPVFFQNIRKEVTHCLLFQTMFKFTFLCSKNNEITALTMSVRSLVAKFEWQEENNQGPCTSCYYI